MLVRADISLAAENPAIRADIEGKARMRPGYHRKRSNPVEKVMRPGLLSLALLIGLALIYVLTPGRSLQTADAGRMTEADQNAVVSQSNDTAEVYDGEEDQRHRECIYVPSIDDFHVIDNRHLTVSTSPRRIYLVTLWNRCTELRFAAQIAIKSTGSWTCSHSRDEILTETQRCMIDDIERVSSRDEARALVAERADSE